MAGVEVAGLAIGVLPVVIEIVKSYKTACERLHTFRAHSKSINRIRVRFQAQESIFRNECCHMFRLVIEDGQEAQDMLKDPTHSRWKDSQLNNRLRRSLGDDYEICKDHLHQINEILGDVRKELLYYDKIWSEKPNGESIQERTQRLREAFTISFKETQYEKTLANLRQWIADLTTLRLERCKLQVPQQPLSRACITHRHLPESITAINQASYKLHESLKEAWCCTNSSHTGHQAKLCVNAKTEDGVCLDMAISCRLRETKVIQDAVTEPPLWLYVQSTTLETHLTPPPLLPASMTKELAVIFQDQETSLPTSTPVTAKRIRFPRIEDLTQRAKKRMKVRFADDNGDDLRDTSSTQKPETADTSSSKIDAKSPTFNLRQSHSVCCHLKQAIRSAGHNCKGTCLGYLETPDLFKLVFYDAGAMASPRSPTQGQVSQETVPLGELIANLPMSSQLELAHKLVIAVLQYHSTPWLAQDWHLRDFSVFGDDRQGTGQEPQDLRTLHVSTQFPEANKHLTQPMEGIESSGVVTAPATMEEIQMLYGINNMTLASLGFALLQIGYRKELQSFKHVTDPHDVVTARKLLAGRHTDLGPKYQEIVRRCIQCDFAFGADLSKTELQSAVYSSVVCPLEEMIKDYQRLTIA